METFFNKIILFLIIVDILSIGNVHFTWTSPIIAKLSSNNTEINPLEKPISDNENSWLGSLLNIGAMVGPFPFSFIAERFGRKIALLCVAVPHLVSFLIFAFAKSVYLYYFARILGGIAVGGAFTLLPMYISEVAEDKNRGMFSVTLHVFWCFGNLLSYIIGPYTSILIFNLILLLIPVLFFVCVLVVAPESPYYLVMNNKLEEAETCLMKLRSQNKKCVEIEINEIKSIVQSEKNKTIYKVLMSKAYLKSLSISFVLIAAQQLSGINAIMFYTQEIFDDAGIDNIAPEICSMITGLISLFASGVVPFVVDRSGRRTMLLISSFGAGLTHLGLGTFFYLKSLGTVSNSAISWLPLTSLILYLIMFTIGLGPLPWTVSSEIFPTNVKPAAAAFTSFSCWTISFFVTKFFVQLNNSLGESGTFWLFAGCCFTTFVFVLTALPETKGKSFADIQKMLVKQHE